LINRHPGFKFNSSRPPAFTPISIPTSNNRKTIPGKYFAGNHTWRVWFVKIISLILFPPPGPRY
jgi:hypothetical protein